RPRDAPHLHAEVTSLYDDHRAAGSQTVAEQSEDLLGHPLLQLRPPGVVLDRAGELREADDAVRRDVADVRRPEEGKEVMRAHRIEGDVHQGDHLRVALVVRERAKVWLALLQTGEELAITTRDPQVRGREVRVVQVELERLEHRAEGARDPTGLRVVAVGRLRPAGFESVEGHCG